MGICYSSNKKLIQETIVFSTNGAEITRYPYVKIQTSTFTHAR